MKAQLNSITDETDENTEKLRTMTRLLLQSQSPTLWNTNIAGNKEVEFETSFNQLLISVCSELGLDSNTVPTFQFYNAISLLEKRNKN